MVTYRGITPTLNHDPQWSTLKAVQLTIKNELGLLHHAHMHVHTILHTHTYRTCTQNKQSQHTRTHTHTCTFTTPRGLGDVGDGRGVSWGGGSWGEDRSRWGADPGVRQRWGDEQGKRW